MNTPCYLSYKSNKPTGSTGPFYIMYFGKDSQGINLTPKSYYYVWNNPSTTSIEGKPEVTPAIPYPHSM